MAGDRLLQH